MQFKSTTISGLFDSSQRHFVIPVYQRAYSWGKEELEVFLSDLKEQIRGGNNYFLGNVLLETLIKDVEYEVIDGQQRLTTTIIFMRSAFDVLLERQETEEIEKDLPMLSFIYLKAGGNTKLIPVEYDRACFQALIIDGVNSFETSTPSQKRVKEAKIYFTTQLRKLPTKAILQIVEKLERTDITAIELQNKKDSALMFELQNNRGKDLTNMEKLKSYFMYQMYVYSPVDETNSNIEFISDLFKHIYIIINDLSSLNEDSVLSYHCQAYIKGYQYRNLDDIKTALVTAENKIEWIKSFTIELHTSFSNMKKMEGSTLKHLSDLRALIIPAFIYPFVIRGYKHFGNNDASMNTLYHILEIVVFRYRLINSRADFISRLNEILTAFNGDLNKLRNHFRNKLNEAWYWGDYRIKEYLNGYMYNNKVLSYILWKYENYIQRSGYAIGSAAITNQQIEHISPQTPSDGGGVATGYETTDEGIYDQEFINEYLHCIGNLMLISGSHNASIGNRPFTHKLQSYSENPLFKQQSELKEFLDPSKLDKWDRAAIDRRHNKIVNEFAIKKWDFNHIYSLIEVI